ncbi:MAG: PaaI family thioesterase [Myxococcota bacterium]|nr:hypothetical protein [Deltaproteobacteria bacterium]MCP4242590.1 PaaI family thioesterase [bacterium]MDP6074332.1 PaaI family thioesterase [Myxococcota bacterium]MDP6242528.1 PaaI family thioesterase [Myxococcota bacterium]MDP7073718.1 PaaI family thioesterase [Myxococcota bacterium]
MDAPEEIVNDQPNNTCFGCSPHNASGLKMSFFELAPGQVESHCTIAPEHCGAPGVAHGGIQAVLLDEAMGMAITAGSEEEAYVVTVEFKLRYRRPVPVGVPLVVRGDLRRREGRDAWVEGAIVDTRGVRLTVAEARWRQIDPPEEAA